jgi:hypothetical protein
MIEKYLESLELAQKAFQTADHMTYITFPLVKEKRLLLRILSELSLSILNTINSILQYEYYNKRIQIYRDARDNFQTFREISPGYEIKPEQLRKLVEIINLAERHKKSPFEFVRNDKIIIMSEGMQTDTVSLEKIKEFLIYVRDFIKKTSLKIKGI